MMMNRKRVLDEFMELVAVPSSTRKERAIADVLKKKLTEAGLQVWEDEVGPMIGGDAGNVMAKLAGNVPGAPRLLLSAHMDCVEPCSGIRPQYKDGIVTSAGDTILGSDCKSGIVPILEALRVVGEKSLPHGDIIVALTVAEEGGLHGAKNMDPKALAADFGYALDGGGAPGAVTVAAPGQNRIAITIHGKTAHAGLAPEEGLNAIVVAGKALAAVPQGRIDFETTCNVGLIKGGVATNIVPDLVEITSEARSRNPEKLKKLTNEIVSTIEDVVKKEGGRCEIATTEMYQSYVLAEESQVVSIAVAAAKSVGLDARTEGSGGGSDSNFFNRFGVPCAVLSTGMCKVHTKEEFIKEEDLYLTTEWTLAIIQAVAKIK